MSVKKYKLSKEKFEQLKLELESLETKGREQIADDLDWLRQLPNDHEDAFFSDVLDDKRYLEKRIFEIKEIVSNCEIVEHADSTDSVSIGSMVKVGFEGYEDEYSIVSALEADPLNKKISDESPVGKALLGAKVGDTIEVKIGPHKKEFRILKIK